MFEDVINRFGEYMANGVAVEVTVECGLTNFAFAFIPCQIYDGVNEVTIEGTNGHSLELPKGQFTVYEDGIDSECLEDKEHELKIYLDF